MTEQTTIQRITVLDESAKDRFAEWISGRGGVKVWENQSLTHRSGQIFTPAKTADGKDFPSPAYTHPRGEVVQDIGAFRFCKTTEVRRLRIHTRMGGTGLFVKLTDHSTKMLRDAMEKLAEKGVETSYHFDYETQEAVISRIEEKE